MRPPQWALRLYSGLLEARMRRAIATPQATQAALLKRIVAMYAPTDVGRALALGDIHDPIQFRDRVPVTEEPFYRPFYARVLAENPPDVVMPGKLTYMARTSGTTSASKHIPYTPAMIASFKRFETKTALHTMRELGNYSLLGANILITSGSPLCDVTPQGLTIGFGSGIMTTLAPAMAKELVRPTRPVLELSDWQAKIEGTVREALPLDIRVMTGVPVFVIPILERLLAHAAEQGRPAPNVKALWPNLAVYYWSGSAITLYASRLRELFGPDVKFRELYACTEAGVAYQYRDGEPGLLLDLENTYYEFQPVDAPLEATRLGVHEVECGVPYRLLLTTWGGLFAYRLSDVVEFVSTSPPLIRILGREKEEISLGFEKLQFHQMRAALDAALAAHGAAVYNFFVCPAPEGQLLAYEWHIEFERPPADLAAFAASLDRYLIETHKVYANMRHHDAILGPTRVEPLQPGAIERYVLATRQFGQGKFVHLYNQREVPLQILAHGEPAP